MDSSRIAGGSTRCFSCDEQKDAHGLPDRSKFTTNTSIDYIWAQLGLPEPHLGHVDDDHGAPALPSSFKIGHLAQASVALSALSASIVYSQHNRLSTDSQPGMTKVSKAHAALEFESEKFYSLDGRPAASGWGPIGGLHEASDGYVRIHDSFINHREAACKILGLDTAVATKDDVARAVKGWKALELEETAVENKAIIYALRSYTEWDALPQAQAVPDFPISIRKVRGFNSSGVPHSMPKNADRCLRGLRVLELSRVIAAPVAGKTLAAHGADVLWVTSPNLPDQPALDIDVQRGKRTIRLDLNEPKDADTLRRLIQDADVFLQSYRPGSLEAKGFGIEDVVKINPSIIYASLNAWGNEGPWAMHRGFDSIVQTVSGMNVSEAEHFGSSPARPMPCQALDHASGYLLATGICAALYQRSERGGAWDVSVSLAGTMKYLRSLGQYPDRSGFYCTNDRAPDQISSFFEERDTAFGKLRAVKHSAVVENKMPGWDIMPKLLGSDEAEWLQLVPN